MTFTPELAAKRFGYGLSPVVAAPASVSEMLAALLGPDLMQERFELGTFAQMQEHYSTYRLARREARKQAGTAEGDAAQKRQVAASRAAWKSNQHWFKQTIQRRIHTADGFRERLVAFWGDHFTAYGKGNVIKHGTAVYVEDAVRPRISGKFSDLLKAAVRHPLMLSYLDQDVSIGPNSVAAKRRKIKYGLNENLAREVLELHTLGVNGPYTQADVRALAHLLTGLTRTRDYGFEFRAQYAEPGLHTVMATTYAGTLSMQRIDAVLDDLADHPATAAHIARKLAVHFVSDTPSDALVEAMTSAYLQDGAQLSDVYAAMLMHPDSWTTPATNIRPPDEFISASLRALGVSSLVFERMGRRTINRVFTQPLRVMGQRWQQPPGPDGWSEDDAAWVTPQGVAGRLEWAMRAPKSLLRVLPDPRDVVGYALGADAPQNVVFAAKAAETRAEGIGLVLMSPAFQRR